MAKTFCDDDFLLTSPSAKRLYNEYARGLPIIDYHCHLSPQEIATNRQFENLSAAWLHGDHYKWRAMRTLGINEKFITGESTDQQKFSKWAYCVPYTLRNPLYHWTHLELRRYFGIDKILSPTTADLVYAEANEFLSHKEFRTQGLLKKMKVNVVCTTDDPIDDLQYHQTIQASGLGIKVLPAFRPDKCLAIDQADSFLSYLIKLGKAADVEIKDLATLFEALENRVDYFHTNGCRLSDHGLEYIHAADFTLASADKALKLSLSGAEISSSQKNIFQSAVLYQLAVMYSTRGWTQQFHLGALRNNNSRMTKTLGPDTGFDSIGDWSQAAAISKFLDSLDKNNQLAKTIIYNLNPSDNEVMATMIGNFNDGSKKGKIQFGSAWWFLDQKDGMEKQLNALSNMGLISCFIGMLTDSRSFLSYPRHEYFRRILCNLFGKDIDNGELPNDLPWIGQIISDVCYNNAKSYFDF